MFSVYVRYVLVTASVCGAAFGVFAMIAGLFSYAFAHTELAIGGFVAAFLFGLNAAYLIDHPPYPRQRSRPWRLFGLWLAAKERELKRRAGG